MRTKSKTQQYWAGGIRQVCAGAKMRTTASGETPNKGGKTHDRDLALDLRRGDNQKCTRRHPDANESLFCPCQSSSVNLRKILAMLRTKRDWVVQSIKVPERLDQQPKVWPWSKVDGAAERKAV